MKTGKMLVLLAAWMLAAPAGAQVDLDSYLKRDRY